LRRGHTVDAVGVLGTVSCPERVPPILVGLLGNKWVDGINPLMHARFTIRSWTMHLHLLVCR
jgi:hypothetical protein